MSTNEIEPVDCGKVLQNYKKTKTMFIILCDHSDVDVCTRSACNRHSSKVMLRLFIYILHFIQKQVAL